MNRILKIALSTSLVFFASTALACDYPAPPKELPDGTKATKDEMFAGVKLISAYQEKMTEYLSCIEADEVVAIQAIGDDEEAKEQRKMMFDKKYNAAIDEQTKTVEEFNAEIRAYKAR